jgi:hypothetical protein
MQDYRYYYARVEAREEFLRRVQRAQPFPSPKGRKKEEERVKEEHTFPLTVMAIDSAIVIAFLSRRIPGIVRLGGFRIIETAIAKRSRAISVRGQEA